MHDPSFLNATPGDPLVHAGQAPLPLAGSLSESDQEARQTMTQRAQRDAFSALLQIIDITTEIFGDDVRIQGASSPDSARDRYVSLTAAIQGDNEAILAKEAEWARRITSVQPVWDGFKLRVKRKQ